MTNKSAGGSTGVKIPETKSVVPGGGEGKLSVGGYHDIRNEVVVSVENPFGVPIGVLVACQLPDNDSFIWLSTGIINGFESSLEYRKYLVKRSESYLGFLRRSQWR